MLDIYTNPDLYDAIHNDVSSDKKMISHYAEKCKGPVLELAAGTGRLAKYIIELGLPYTGIDTSKEFIEEARNRFGDQGKFKIDNVIGGTYQLFAYQDRNNNKILDTGNLNDGNNSEKFYVYTDSLILRTNWELEIEDWNIDQ